MGNAPRQQSEFNLYHVVARGVAKQIIFEDDADRRAYLACLKSAMTEKCVEVHAWCLMDNHTHLLVCTPLDELSAFVRVVHGRYATRFNQRHRRVGHLFQGRFKSEAITTEEQLLAVVRYIHQNPVKAGLSRDCDYRWSSYRSYLTGRGATSTDLVLSMFGTLDDFRAFNHTPGKENVCLEATWASEQLTVEDCLTEAQRVLGAVPAQDLRSLPRETRDRYLAALKKAKIPVRQIEKLTGIPRTTIGRVPLSLAEPKDAPEVSPGIS